MSWRLRGNSGSVWSWLALWILHSLKGGRKIECSHQPEDSAIRIPRPQGCTWQLTVTTPKHKSVIKFYLHTSHIFSDWQADDLDVRNSYGNLTRIIDPWTWSGIVTYRLCFQHGLHVYQPFLSCFCDTFMLGFIFNVVRLGKVYCQLWNFGLHENRIVHFILTFFQFPFWFRWNFHLTGWLVFK